MAVTQQGPSALTTPRDHAPSRDHGFHRLAVSRVVPETADASSFVLAIPPELEDAFVYAAGQFCTFRVVIDDMTLLRCYSMSSAPGVDDELAVTVKRVPGGAVSNWMLDHIESGHDVDVTAPAGVFLLQSDEDEVITFAAGSGITPVFSLVKTALHQTDRRVRLLYANRDPASVIFAAQIDALTAEFPGRLEVVHHFDVDGGFVDADEVRTFLGTDVPLDAGCYLCGPPPFMDVVEHALLADGMPAARVHIERFTPAEEPATGDCDDTDAGETPCHVTIELEGQQGTADHHAGATILQTARQLGFAPPFSCESGSCATCMARVVEGSVEMHVNNALTDEELEEGWILTCQAVPTTAEVSVIYGFDGA